MGELTNTAGNRRGLKGKRFVKGDPRINRKGRPKSFDAFRALGLQIASETVAAASKKFGDTPPHPALASLTVAEYILRKWALSSDPHLQRAFTEVAFGKIPDELKIDPQSVITLKVEFINKSNGNGHQ